MYFNGFDYEKNNNNYQHSCYSAQGTSEELGYIFTTIGLYYSNITFMKIITTSHFVKVVHVESIWIFPLFVKFL